MIVVTGAAGFIGSNIVADLEASGLGPIAVCDWFGTGDKWRNLAKRTISAFIEPEQLLGFLQTQGSAVTCVIHMGAISATTERDVDALVRHNIDTTVMLWDWCAAQSVPFIYASSAATYGALEAGLVDDECVAAAAALRPLNAYGWSKKATDQILLARAATGRAPPQWVGLKFFNVYGPNEQHKGEMMSVIAKLFAQVKAGNAVNLFKSDRPGTAHGQQKRDFVYVKDCTRAIIWLMQHRQVSGIFNLGTGVARSFADLVHGIGLALERPVQINYIDMPESLRGKYQYFTQAEMSKLQGRGLGLAFHSLESGIADYVRSHLDTEDPYR